MTTALVLGVLLIILIAQPGVQMVLMHLLAKLDQ
jgi:hypothetical protein